MSICFDPHICFVDGKVAGNSREPVLEPPVLQMLEALAATGQGSPTASATQGHGAA